MTYQLVSVDAWGSDEGSWNWNNWFATGHEVEADKAPNTVIEFLQYMVDEGMITLEKPIAEVAKSFVLTDPSGNEHDTIELCEIEIGMYCDDECEDDCDEHLVSPRPIYAFIWKGDYQ